MVFCVLVTHFSIELFFHLTVVVVCKYGEVVGKIEAQSNNQRDAHKTGR